MLEKYLTFFLCKPGGYHWSALAWGNLEPSYACMGFFPAVHSVSWWQATFDWGSVKCFRQIFIVRKMTEQLDLRKSNFMLKSHRTFWTPQWPLLHEHHNHWWQILGGWVQPKNHISVVNENLTRALNTTSLKCSDPVFMNTIIIGDKSWVYGYNPETKSQSWMKIWLEH